MTASILSDLSTLAAGPCELWCFATHIRGNVPLMYECIIVCVCLYVGVLLFR